MNLQEMNISKLLSAKDVAEMLGISYVTLTLWARNEVIPHYKFGGSYKFDEDEIREWIKQNHKGVAKDA